MNLHKAKEALAKSVQVSKHMQTILQYSDLSGK